MISIAMKASAQPGGALSMMVHEECVGWLDKVDCGWMDGCLCDWYDVGRLQ